MPDSPVRVPVFMRVGDSPESHIGDLHEPTSLPELLRAAADEAEKHLANHPESEHH